MGEFVEGYRRARGAQYARLASLLDAHPNGFRFSAAVTLAVATGLLAQVQVYTPLTPVPFTLQTFGVALMGGLLGRKWGPASALLYLAMGLVGLPVFAGQVADAGGFGAALAATTWMGGLRVFETALSAGFLLGFPLMAYATGWARDLPTRSRTGWLVGFAPAAIAVLLLFAGLDAFALADASANTYYTGPTQALFFGLLLAALLVLTLGVAWLVFTTRARRERVELFLAGMVGAGLVHLVGGAWFYAAAPRLGLPEVTLWQTLRFTLFPFLAWDIVKVLGAVGLLTLARPSQRELAKETPHV